MSKKIEVIQVHMLAPMAIHKEDYGETSAAKEIIVALETEILSQAD